MAINWKNDNGVPICRHDVIAFILHCFVFLVKFSCWSKFHINIIAWSGVMTVFFYIRDWPAIRKSEIVPSEFCQISGDLGKSRIPNLARMFLIKCYWMLKNTRVAAFSVSEFPESLKKCFSLRRFNFVNERAIREKFFPRKFLPLKWSVWHPGLFWEPSEALHQLDLKSLRFHFNTTQSISFPITIDTLSLLILSKVLILISKLTKTCMLNDD